MTIKNKTYFLFLDDYRNLEDTFEFTHIPMFLKEEWVIVRSYDEFVKRVTELFKEDLFPEMVSFDHDLADVHYNPKIWEKNLDYDEMEEKTGFHCAKWLVDFCIKNKLKFPRYFIHSMNPIGARNIFKYIENAKSHTEI